MTFGYLASRAGPGGKVTRGARGSSRLKAERRARPLEIRPPPNGEEVLFGENLAASGVVTGEDCAIRPQTSREAATCTSLGRQPQER